MPVNQKDIDEVQKIIDSLEQVQKNRARAEARLEREMEILNSFGYSSTEESEKAVEELDKKIVKREKSLNLEFEDFMEDYGSLF